MCAVGTTTVSNKNASRRPALRKTLITIAGFIRKVYGLFRSHCHYDQELSNCNNVAINEAEFLFSLQNER
jgi:hypothetical protein